MYRVAMLAVAGLLALPSAVLAAAIDLSVSPRPVNACSNLTVGWSAELQSLSAVELVLTNTRHTGEVYWRSPVVTAQGTSSGTYSLRTGKHWPATNGKDGAAYKLEAYLDGTRVAETGVPIFALKNNTAPVAWDSSASLDEDTSVSGTLYATDSDGEVLLFSLAEESPHGRTEIDALSGTFSFTPDADWNGTTSFVYQVEDCAYVRYATVTLLVFPVNDAPVAGPLQVESLEDTVYAGVLPAHDVDGDVLQFGLIDPPAHGAVVIDPFSGGFEFRPDADWYGETSFTFHVFDGSLYSAPATVSLTVLPVNDPPEAQPYSGVLDEGQTLYAQLHGSDIDGDPIAYSVFSSPSNGVLDLAADGSFTYTPRAGWYGTDRFAFRVFDGQAYSDPVDAYLEVRHVNVAPYAWGATFTTQEGMPVDGYLSGHDPEGAPLTFHLRQESPYGAVSLDTWTGMFTFVPLPGWSGTTSFTFVTSDGELESSEAVIQIVVYPGGPVLPPDPATVAPPLSPIELTDLYEATSFLFEGPAPIQMGVASGAIVANRIAVLRGRVLNREQEPLPGVQVVINGHPELGYTLTRSDGRFDLAVNGGGRVTLEYHLEGHMPVQRTRDIPWQDYVTFDDVVLTPYDPKATVIGMSAPVLQTAVGSEVADDVGARRPMLVFAPGTRAWLKARDGSLTEVDALTIRATEYTVGAAGPAAMPGELPSSTAYTFAINYTADEAIAADATGVTFSKPVIAYVENFYGFPVGTAMPVGTYDRSQAIWSPLENGAVMALVGVEAGMALLDTDGDGAADPISRLDALGITDDERRLLAETYAVGQSVWRVEHSHFSDKDYNHLFAELDAPAPDLSGTATPELEGTAEPDTPCPGCIVYPETQAFGESIAITGTGLKLNYKSQRVPGQKASRRLTIPLFSDFPPSNVVHARLDISIAGNRHRIYAVPAPGAKYVFEWDGLDAYGRRLQGPQPVNVTLTYVYRFEYLISDFWCHDGFEYYQCPALFGSLNLTAWGRSFSVYAGSNYILRDSSTSWSGKLGTWEGTHVNGWSVSEHHHYDARSGILMTGDGNTSRVQDLPNTVQTLAYRPLGMEAIAMGPDGSVFFSERAIAGTQYPWIGRLWPDGSVTRVAGGGSTEPEDGASAAGVRLLWPAGVAVDQGGTVYFAEFGGMRVWKVTPDGILHRVAGTGVEGSTGDGGLATEATLTRPRGIALHPDGSLFIADTGAHRIRRVMPDGRIETVAGGGSSYQNGVYGTQSTVVAPYAVAIANDGGILIADSNNRAIRRLSPTGIITTVANMYGYPMAVFQAPDGTIYYVERGSSGGYPIFSLRSDGTRTRLLGNYGRYGFSGDGGPAIDASNREIYSLALDQEGRLLFADAGNRRIRRISPPFAGATLDRYVVPSGDGAQLYVFNRRGRHLRTVDAVTGADVWTFAYDPAGWLTSLTDVDGKTTWIERDLLGHASAIVAPYGQRTELVIDSNKYLAGVIDPAGNETELYHSADGLLRRIRTPIGGEDMASYTASGLLYRNRNPLGGMQYLAKTGGRVDMTDPLGRLTRIDIVRGASGQERRAVTRPDGSREITERDTGGATVRNVSGGIRTTTTVKPDPRFGMNSPYTASEAVRMASGRTRTSTTVKTVTLANRLDPLSMTARDEVQTVNGRVYASQWRAATRTNRRLTPEGRESVSVHDEKGRVVAQETPGIAPTNLTYRDDGKLTEIRQTAADGEARVTGMDYDPLGRLAELVDPAGRRVRFGYDAADRLTWQELPDGRIVSYAYDGAGNLTSVTPPGRPAHEFLYNPAGLTSDYQPPRIGGPVATTYDYNQAKQLVAVNRPDGVTVEYLYEGDNDPRLPLPNPNTGRLKKIVQPRGDTTFGYDSAGRLANITAPDGGVLSYAYDGSLLLSTTWSNGEVNGSISRTYDNNFWVTSESVNGANTVNFTYDLDGLLTGANTTVNGSAVDFVIARDPDNGLITGSSIGGVSDSISYNGFAEPIGYTATFNGTNTLYDVSYVRDAIGRISSKTETVNGVTTTYDYHYDLAGRLTGVDKNGIPSSSYTYDSNGNRLSYSGELGSFTGTYDAQDRLLTYGDFVYEYTANGELRRKENVVTGEVWEYRYDANGNLLSVSLPDGRLIEYVIDGQNRRIGKKIDGVFVKGWLYGGNLRISAQIDATGNVVGRFFSDLAGAAPAYMVKDGKTYRLITNHLGSVRYVVDIVTGNVVQHIEYDEFGNVQHDSNPNFQPFGFAFGLYDVDTGLVRFGERDYDPTSGLWITKDPIRFGGGLNLYGYVNNDPVNWVDPSGLENTCPYPPPPYDPPLEDPDWDPIDTVVDVLTGGMAGAGRRTVTTILNAVGKKIKGKTKHGAERQRQRQVTDEAMEDAVENPVSVIEQPDRGTTRYEGREATVVVNENGEVVTTWRTK